MKKILIAYWKELNLIAGITHNQEFDYSIKKQNELTQMFMDAGYSIMLIPNMGNEKDTLLIWIDKGRFGQS